MSLALAGRLNYCTTKKALTMSLDMDLSLSCADHLRGLFGLNFWSSALGNIFTKFPHLHVHHCLSWTDLYFLFFPIFQVFLPLLCGKAVSTVFQPFC